MQADYITPAVTIFDDQGHVDIEANKKFPDSWKYRIILWYSSGREEAADT